MLCLRPATFADADRLLEWRNEPAVREASFTTDEVSRDAHVAWLSRKLADPSCLLFIVEEDGSAIGQIRLDCDGNEAEISIALTAAARGRGIGREAIRLALRESPCQTIVALVKPDNPGSLAAFRAAGFNPVSEDERAVKLTACTPPR